MSWAAAAAGADGIMVEVHPEPMKALSDGEQALTFEDFRSLVPRLHRVLQAVDGPLLEIPQVQRRELPTWIN